MCFDAGIFFTVFYVSTPISLVFLYRKYRYYFLFFAHSFIRRSLERIFLRSLMLIGVTSTSSSSAINSRHCSSERIVGGISFNASSLPEARLFVRCFCLHTLTAKSSSLEFSPTTSPSYTFSPAPMNRVQRS